MEAMVRLAAMAIPIAVVAMALVTAPAARGQDATSPAPAIGSAGASAAEVDPGAPGGMEDRPPAGPPAAEAAPEDAAAGEGASETAAVDDGAADTAAPDDEATAAQDEEDEAPDTPTEAVDDRAAQDAAKAEAEAAAAKVAELCEVLVAAADAHDVPHDFFIRLIWKESRFNDGAVSPVGAQGIAQFMPGTARLRGLVDPFDRRTALFASASFLADLQAEFGSWGLAAAGYNGGPNRLPALIAGQGSLPYETVDYVFSITGRPAEFWAARARARIARGEREDRPAGWIGRGLTAEEIAALSPSAARAEPGAAADAAEPGDTGSAPAMIAEAGEAVDAGPDEGAVISVSASLPADAVAGADATVQTDGEEATFPSASPQASDGEVPATDASEAATAARPTMPSYPPTLLALARPPFVLPVPRARPDYMPAVDCPTLVARLGRSRSVAPPSIAGGWSPWGAQVAGHVRRDVAMRQYDRLKVRLPGDLVGTAPNVVVRRFAARGRLAIHAVQFGAGSRGEAEALCARVAQSRAPCVVVRNR